MALKFLDRGEHFDLCIHLGDTVYCFAEHFDSFVKHITGDSIVAAKTLQRLKNNPYILVEDDYNEQKKTINLTDVLNDKKKVIIFDSRGRNGYCFSIGDKFGNCFHGYGAIKVTDFNELNIIYSTRTRNSLIMTLYHITFKEEFTCEKIDEKLISLSQTEGFVLPCSEEEMIEFLEKDEGMISAQKSIFENAVLDCYSYYPNYAQKYSNFSSCFHLGAMRADANVEIFYLFYWFSKPEYYNFVESCIQRNENEEIVNKNPYYTGVMPSPNSLPHLNSKAETYAKQMGFNKDMIRDLSDLEDNPKVGPDGLNIILEFVLKSTKANANRDYEKRIKVCENEMYWRIPHVLLDIFKTFDITPKLFIDRTIREMMNNYMDAATYWNCICDYTNMCYQLGIEVDKKLPKDIIHRHDILSTKIKELKDEAIKKEFAIRVAENKKLLENIPDGNYTIISPETSNDLVEEGFRMNHCVGSYAYSFASGSSKIFFVRSKTNIDIPLATLELDHFNRLVQISSFANKKPEKSVLDFVNEWLKMI